MLALPLCILFAFFHIKNALKEAKKVKEKNEKHTRISQKNPIYI